MKKAYIIKNYQAGWGIQNRVEALVDWGRDGLAPYEIDVLGQNALITVDDAKKASYESDYQWEQDIATMNGLLNDIQDPIFADDGQVLKYIDMESATPDAIKDFTQFAIENCSTLGYDMLRPFGLEMPKTEEEQQAIDQSQTDRVKELEAMAKNINLSSGMEDLNSLTTDEPIEEYSRETDPLLSQAEHVTDESDPVNEPEPVTEPSTPVAEAPEVEPAVAVATASGGDAGRIVDPRKEFLDEFMDACKDYDITPKGLVAVLMSIKALANKAADVSNVTAEDVTGEEDYTYSNAVPYVQNPHEKEPEIAEQGMNVPEAEDNTEVGNESIINNGLLHIFSSKRNNRITTDELNELVSEIDSRIKVVLPKYHKILEDIRENHLVVPAHKAMFEIKYRIERMNNKIRFAIINVDKFSAIKGNIQVELTAMLTGMLAGMAGVNTVVLMNPMSPELRAKFEAGDLDVLNESITSKINSLCTGYKYGKLDGHTLGIEIEYVLAESHSTESIDTIDVPEEADTTDIYSELVNDGPIDLGFESHWFNHNIEADEYVECSMEGLFSRRKKKSDNEVINDINKVCEDLKEVAKKAWEELKDKNQDLINKYGAFIKILLDIKDVIFMDKRNIVLEVADFEIKKANNEIVPDSTEEMILKQVSKASIGIAFGPFAQLAATEDKPGQTMLLMANELRAQLIKYLKHKKLDITPSVELIENELHGSYKLVVSFKDLPKISNESLAEEIPLIERLAKEATDDNDFFDKIIEHKDDIKYELAMECVNVNMWNYYKTGEKVLLDRAVSGQRIIRYIKK